MITSTLTSKNQTTIPKAVIQALGLPPAGQLVYEIGEDGHVMLTAKVATFAGLADSFPKKTGQRPATQVQIDAAIKDQAVKRYRKSRA